MKRESRTTKKWMQEEEKRRRKNLARKEIQKNRHAQKLLITALMSNLGMRPVPGTKNLQFRRISPDGI